MQIADLSSDEITELAKIAKKYPIDVLYFADSLGSLNKSKLKSIIETFQKSWSGDLGIHTHDNIGQAINNTLSAVKFGVTWVDSTVTGMGRGPGNAQTEYLILALENYRKKKTNIIKLLQLIDKYFKPMKKKYEWGINAFYFLSGKFGIHPTYIQEMLKDKRFNEEDILTVIEFLKKHGGKKFDFNTLETARQFFSSKPKGKWRPESLIKGKKILIIGSGPGVENYRSAIEDFINKTKPYVLALNTQPIINNNLINAYVVSHPIRLLTDYKDHLKFKKPLILPFSMLPEEFKKDMKFKNTKILDYGIKISKKGFKFGQKYCQLPSLLVFAYSLAIANSGHAEEIFLAGFDGYVSEDARKKEMDEIIKKYKNISGAASLISITPTKYDINTKSVFAIKN